MIIEKVTVTQKLLKRKNLTMTTVTQRQIKKEVDLNRGIIVMLLSVASYEV